MTCLCIDDLRPASFRGVGFFVASDQGEYGRRGPVHEYPNRDNPYFEDLGEKARKFTVNGYLFGDDWVSKKDAIVAACTARGPAILQLPTEGTTMVACQNLSVSRTKDECGYYALKFQFVVASFSAPGAIAAEFESLIGSIFSAAIPTFTTFFDNTYVPRNTLNFVSENMTDRISQYSSDVVSAIEGMPTNNPTLATDVVQAGVSIFQNAATYAQPGTDSCAVLAQQTIPAQTIAAIANDTGVTKIGDSGVTIQTGAAAIVPMIAYTINGIGNALTSDVVIPTLTSFATWSVNEVSLADLQAQVDALDTPTAAPISASDTADAVNSTVFCGVVRSFALMKLAQAICAKTFLTRKEAIQARATVVELFNAQIEQFAEDEIVNIMLTARDYAVRSITQKMATIVPVITITAPQSRPSLYWAARLYEDVYRAEELADRNEVASPAFMPGTFEALAR